jgi:hypothetical protein
VDAAANYVRGSQRRSRLAIPTKDAGAKSGVTNNVWLWVLAGIAVMFMFGYWGKRR